MITKVWKKRDKPWLHVLNNRKVFLHYMRKGEDREEEEWADLVETAGS